MAKYIEKTSERLATIDRNAYKPAYAQLVGILRDRIANGEFLPGTRLPPEVQLCKTYNVSPMTVRRAINLLLDEGIISTTQGKGTFVKRLDLGAINFKLELFLNIFKDKERVKVKMLGASIKRADELIASRIAVDVGAKIVFMRRVILYEKKPIIYHEENIIYNPKLPIIESEMELTALYGLFMKKEDTHLKKGRFKIEAALLTPEQSKLLQMPSQSAAFRLEHVFYDYSDNPVSLGWFILGNEAMDLKGTVGVWQNEFE